MEIAAFPNSFHSFTKHPFHRPLSSNHLSTSYLQISSSLSAINAVAPPPVRSTTSSRNLLKRRRRTRRRPRSSGGSQDDGFFIGGGDDGAFGGSGGGSGGGWNFDGFGGFGWDDSSSSPPDPAFDFVFEVICWLLLSNCLHFAYKKVVRLVAEGFPGHGRN